MNFDDDLRYEYAFSVMIVVWWHDWCWTGDNI